MSELNIKTNAMTRKTRHRGRMSQVPIYLGKLLRSFIYQNDWKVLPMAALIAALVSMVVRRDFFMTMEGTLKGAFALTCVAIWNGCFNSIQSVCRERNIIKREHRSGMHITSYVLSHMIYQALLCLTQTALTLYVCMLSGVKFPVDGFMTPWLIVDIGITMFLISYGSDMISLFVSSIVRTTTAAMTVMPFLLIFQLVFSGGIFALPPWVQPLTRYTISNYGLKCIAAQADYNNQPMVTAWNTLYKLRNDDANISVRVGHILDILSDQENPTIARLRTTALNGTVTVGDIITFLKGSPEFLQMLLQENAAEIQSVQQAISDFQQDELPEQLSNLAIITYKNFGEVIDAFVGNSWIQANREEILSFSFKLGDVINLFGEETVQTLIQQKTADASRVEAYERTEDNIVMYWFQISLFIWVFGLLSVLVLEMIDKDKR